MDRLKEVFKVQIETEFKKIYFKLPCYPSELCFEFIMTAF